MTRLFDPAIFDPAIFDTSAAVEPVVLPTGHLHIGKFITAVPLYTLENEIINQDEIDDGRLRANVVVVDGLQDSWTEYDRDDLIARDTAITAYLDLPELKTPGDVRQRAVEEVQTARGVTSPGGDVAGPVVLSITRMDPIFWIDEHGNKYQTRIEGKSVEWNQSLTPFQRASIDTGAIIFCPPEGDELTYIARDLFDRDTAIGLGSALTGGDWVIT
jgi:hypothetical protein